MRKILFFDIDGTLWNHYNVIPQSTKEAIRQARENGHLAFICSGRARGYIQNEELLGIGFDGIVSGCGTMCEYNGAILDYYQLDNELLDRTIKIVRKYGMRPILEGRDYLYFDEADFGKDLYGQKLMKELQGRWKEISTNEGGWEASKLSCDTSVADTAACMKELEADYDFIIHNEKICEIVPKGYHKGVGLIKVCERLGIDIKDSFAFGDSVNDLGMFRAAGTGVAMGNGSDEIKAAADYVTDTMDNDGIWNACKHFGLI